MEKIVERRDHDDFCRVVDFVMDDDACEMVAVVVEDSEEARAVEFGLHRDHTGGLEVSSRTLLHHQGRLLGEESLLLPWYMGFPVKAEEMVDGGLVVVVAVDCHRHRRT